MSRCGVEGNREALQHRTRGTGTMETVDGDGVKGKAEGGVLCKLFGNDHP